jgi:hypothetical protein
MENSTNSMSKALSSNERSPEESGWTVYFEDFLVNNNNNEEEHSYCSSRFKSSSLVSDAASLAGKKSLDKISSKRLSFKKRKTIGALVDDALENYFIFIFFFFFFFFIFAFFDLVWKMINFFFSLFCFGRFVI